MTRSASLFVVLALTPLFGACYESKSIASDDLVAIDAPPMKSLQADGATVLDFAVLVDPDTTAATAINVAVSSGTLAVNADPKTADARALTLKNLGTGRLPFKLRVGTTPGDLLVTASVGGFMDTAIVKLIASPVTAIDLQANKRVITADGESGVDITARLFADDAAKDVSLGARVQFDVCCPDGDGVPAPCSAADPLIVPQLTRLDSGQLIQVRGIADRLLVEVGKPTITPVLVVAQLRDPSLPAKHCEVREPSAILPLSLKAIAP